MENPSSFPTTADFAMHTADKNEKKLELLTKRVTILENIINKTIFINKQTERCKHPFYAKNYPNEGDKICVSCGERLC